MGGKMAVVVFGLVMMIMVVLCYTMYKIYIGTCIIELNLMCRCMYTYTEHIV